MVVSALESFLFVDSGHCAITLLLSMRGALLHELGLLLTLESEIIEGYCDFVFADDVIE